MSNKVLCVGFICLDVIQLCNNYPLEDSEQRALECWLKRGGNASNTCTVLSLLGNSCECFGTLGRSPFLEFISKDFKKYDIDVQHCRVYEDCEFPLTTVLLNSLNGSRTIVHTNKLPEPLFTDFKRVNLQEYSWIHFEGRNIVEIEKMINFVKKEMPYMKISLELEKPRNGLLKLVPLADLVIVGKDFSIPFGWEDMETTIEKMKEYIKPSTLLMSTWGEKGAMATGPEGTFHIPAYSPEKIVDTIGAGDTFCAAAIHTLLRNCSLKESLDFACKIAGYKVGIYGYDELKLFAQEQ